MATVPTRCGRGIWRRHRRLRSRALLIVSTTAALVGCVSVGGASGASPFPSPGTASRIATLVRASHRIDSLPRNLLPSLGDVSTDNFETYYPAAAGYGCVTATQCTFGDVSSSKTVVLYGDSHAAMWLPALIPAVTAAAERLVLLWYPFCPTADVSVWNPLTHQPDTQCNAYRAQAMSMIGRLEPSLVLLADRASGNRSFTNDRISNAAWITGEVRTIKALENSSTKVVVIGDVSTFSSNTATCLAAYPSAVQRCSVRNPHPTTDQHFAAERAAAKAEKVPYLDPERWLCTSTCSPVVGNMVVFTDSNHVTSTYAAFLSGVFTAALRPEL